MQNNRPMSDLQPDEEFMLQVHNGAVYELAVLFERHHVALFNFFYRMNGDRSTSEDLVQETFYRILKYRQSYRPGSSFRTWMYQIARNVRADQFNKQRDEVDLEQAPAPAVAPVDTVEGPQLVGHLKQALMQIPDDKRELLILSRFQGLKYEEIARLLNCEVGTVKVRVYRALQELKEAFQRRQAGHRPRSRAQDKLGD